MDANGPWKTCARLQTAMMAACIYIKGELNAVERWAGRRKARIMQVIVREDAFVRLDEAVKGEMMWLQKVNYEIDVADRTAGL